MPSFAVILALSVARAATVDDTSPPIPAPAGVAVDGKVVLVNFWASWCGPCLVELPHLDRLAQRLDPSEALVVAVNVDQQRRPADAVLRHLGVGLPVVWDAAGAVAEGFDPPALPATYLIDSDRRIRAVFHGGLDEAEIAAIEVQMRGLARESRDP